MFPLTRFYLPFFVSSLMFKDSFIYDLKTEADKYAKTTAFTLKTKPTNQRFRHSLPVRYIQPKQWPIKTRHVSSLYSTIPYNNNGHSTVSRFQQHTASHHLPFQVQSWNSKACCRSCYHLGQITLFVPYI